MNCLNKKSNSSIINVHNQEIQYVQKGIGKVIVCLPPPLLDHRIYCEIQDKLSPSFKTVALDLPQAEDVDQLIELLKEIIEIGTTHPFHLLASSASGWLAQYLAHEFNDQLQSLILINSFHSTSEFGTKYRLALKSTKLLPSYKFKKEVLEKAKVLIKGVDDKIYTNYLKNRVNVLGKSGIRKQMSWFLENRPDPEPLEIPVLSIYPKYDALISKDDHESLRIYHSNSVSVEIESETHLPFITQSNLIVDKIVRFINSVL